MAGRTALFDLVDMIVGCLQAATTSGGPLEGVFVHDGPATQQAGGDYLFVTSAVEADREDEISLDATAYDITYEVGLGLSHVDPTGSAADPDANRLARRRLGEIVQTVAGMLETDGQILDLVRGVDVIAVGYSPVVRPQGLQVVAEVTVLADVSVQP